MSLTAAPHLPATRTGSTRPCQLPAAPPSVLLLTAANCPAMVVPCQLERKASGQPANLSGWARRSAAVMASPGSAGSLSRPLPSPAYTGSATKSKPGSTRALVSMCEVMPESSTATTAPGLARLTTPVLRSQALAKPAAPVLPAATACNHHWAPKRGSAGVTSCRCSRTSGTTASTRGSARKRASVLRADSPPGVAGSSKRCHRPPSARSMASGNGASRSTDCACAVPAAAPGSASAAGSARS